MLPALRAELFMGNRTGMTKDLFSKSFLVSLTTTKISTDVRANTKLQSYLYVKQ